MAPSGIATKTMMRITSPFETRDLEARRRGYPCRVFSYLTDQSINFEGAQDVVDLTLTDEQQDLRELAHSFAEKDIRKVAWEYDKDGTWPQDIIDKAWEIGLMNTHVAEEYGGPGLDYLSGCLIEEEIGWGC